MRKQDIKVGEQVGYKPSRLGMPIVVTVTAVSEFEPVRRYGRVAPTTAVDIEWERANLVTEDLELVRRRVPPRDLVSMAEVEAYRVRNEVAKAERIALEQARATAHAQLDELIERANARVPGLGLVRANLSTTGLGIDQLKVLLAALAETA